jgi:hypothetical protein
MPPKPPNRTEPSVDEINSAQNPVDECKRDVTPVENAGSKSVRPPLQKALPHIHPQRSRDRRMAMPVALPTAKRKRGKPDRGRPIAPSLALATEFEMRVTA